MHTTRLTTKPTHEVIAAIHALDLTSIKVRMMDEELGEGWSQEYADSIEAAYKTYLTMVAKYPEHAEDLMLAKDVDEFWHAHILHTTKYAQDCQTVYGFFLHHTPQRRTGTAEEARRREASAAKTRELYEREFGSGQQAAGAAYCGAAPQAVYCGAAPQAAYCGAAPAAAYCGAAPQAAYCGAAPQAAYCGAAPQAAYCGAAPQAAYCGAAPQAAYCGAAPQAAYCGARVEAAEIAYCGAAPESQTVRREAAAPGKAYCGAAPAAPGASYCGARASTEPS